MRNVPNWVRGGGGFMVDLGEGGSGAEAWILGREGRGRGGYAVKEGISREGEGGSGREEGRRGKEGWILDNGRRGWVWANPGHLVKTSAPLLMFVARQWCLRVFWYSSGLVRGSSMVGSNSIGDYGKGGERNPREQGCLVGFRRGVELKLILELVF